MPRSFIRKRIYICAAIILSLFWGERLLCRFLFLQTKSQSTWDIPYNPQELEHIKAILKQPLRFLGVGSQCFAFVSKDDQYVIKICKAPRYKNPQKKEADFLSYLLAFQQIPTQSQMIFLHLNPTETLQIPLKILDPLGLPHFLKADHLSFYIQKKLTPFRDYLEPILPTLSILQARNIVDELLELCAASCKKPIQVRDIQLKNIGRQEGKFFWMDPGRIRKKNALPSFEEQKKEFSRLSSRLKPFLTALHPIFASVLEEAIPKKLNDLNVLAESPDFPKS